MAGSLKVVKFKPVEAYVNEASPLMMLLPFQFDGEFTRIDEDPVASTSIGWLPRVQIEQTNL